MSLTIKTILVFVIFLYFSLNSFEAFADTTDISENITSAKAVNSVELKTLKNSNTLKFQMNVNDQVLSFHLSDNDNLLSKNSPYRANDNIRFLKGNIVGSENSSARFTLVGKNITGAFIVDGSLFLLKEYTKVEAKLSSNALKGQYKNQSNSAGSRLVVINANDIKTNGICALHDHSSSEFFNYKEYTRELKDNAKAMAAQQITITLVADTHFVNGRSAGEATVDMLSHLSFADLIFEQQLNINLIEDESIELIDNGDFVSTAPEPLLNSFANSNLFDPELRHLFTGLELDGSTVGIAYVSRLCDRFAAGLTRDIGTLTELVFTHELGHNFGAGHDANNVTGFIMHPIINQGGETFSQASIDQIAPFIASSYCVIDVGQAPIITSTPNENVMFGEQYLYDGDSTLEVEGTTPLTFVLDIAPNGMTLNSDGLLEWTPSEDDLGLNPVQITVTNASGQDTQYFEVNVNTDFIDFGTATISPYGRGQDVTDTASVGDSRFTLELTGNTWKSIPHDYNVTAFTVLEFEFSSTREGEIHGIGFDNNDTISQNTTFNLYGTQNWGLVGPQYNGTGETQLVRINVGHFFSGTYNRLIFVMDDDTNSGQANSTFTNVRIFEDTEGTPIQTILDLSSRSINSFLPNIQDVVGTMELIEEGNGIEITGNNWKKIIFENVFIGANTLLTFDFKSDAEGEIHGLGFLTNKVQGNKTIQLFGTQNWGIRDYTYTGNGEYQSFEIPIGTYLTQTQLELVFVNDHDVSNPTASSTFRNITIIQPQ